MQTKKHNDIGRISNADLLSYVIASAEAEGIIKENDKVSISASVGEHICENIENSYSNIISGIHALGYRLDWANHYSRNLDLRPSSATNVPEEHCMLLRFFDHQNLSDIEVVSLNERFHRDLLSSSFKEMMDLFGVYVDFLNDVCFIIQHKEKDITKAQIRTAQKLPKGKLEDKLSALTKNYKFPDLYNEKLLSLYEARNRYTHSDPNFSPVPLEKRKNTVSWLSHTVKMRRKNSSQWLPIEKTLSFAKEGKMGRAKIKTKFFSKEASKRFLDDAGKPQLNEWDIRQIMHFMILVMECFHSHFVSFAKSSGFEPRPFSEYRYKLEISLEMKE